MESVKAVILGKPVYLLNGARKAPRKDKLDVDSPEKLLEAARRLGVAPSDCVYVGDDERDVVAARAAGMPSIAVTWGYRLDGEDPETWRAEAIARDPRELLDPAAWPRPTL